jgi:hypothetical protein
MGPKWLEWSLVVVAAAAIALLLVDSTLSIALAAVLFLSCPILMLVVWVGLHGRTDRGSGTI